jgi:tetratricopeptide (TPR) repeat protein
MSQKYERLEKSNIEVKVLLDELKAIFNRIQGDLRNNEFDKAKDNIKYGIGLKKDHAPFYYCLGSLHYLKDENDEAINALKISITLDNSYFEPKFLLACIYKLRKDFTNAEKALKDLKPLIPEMLQIHEMLGDIYLEMGMLEMAKEEYMEVLKVEPDNSEVRFKSTFMEMF